MKNTLEDKIANASTLFDVLMITKEKIMLDTHVATLGYVKKKNEKVGNYGILEVAPFPLRDNQTSYQIEAYYFNVEDYEEGDIILVVFTDYNFISNLKSIDKEPKTTLDNGIHQIKYGIAIKV